VTTERTIKRTSGRPRGRRTDYDPLLGVRVPPAVRAGLDLIAAQQGISLSQLARQIFQTYLDMQDARENYQQAVMRHYAIFDNSAAMQSRPSAPPTTAPFESTSPGV
jgi:hypothetical protein